MGVPSPVLAAWATSLLELLGGISIVIGAAVVPLSAPFAAVMATALFGIHARYGFSSIRLKSLSSTGAVFCPVTYELTLLYIAALLERALGTSTPVSVDRWI